MSTLQHRQQLYCFGMCVTVNGAEFQREDEENPWDNGNELEREEDNRKMKDDRNDLATVRKFNELESEIKGTIQRQGDGNPWDDRGNDDGEHMDTELDDHETAAEQSSYTYARMYDNKVIYIESYRRRGRWLDASYRKPWAYFQQVHQDDVVDKRGVKWLVKDVGGGAVVLENMLYKRHYLNAHHSGWCKVSYSSYPQGINWAKFKIETAGNGRFYFRSVRYSNKRLDEYESFWHKYWGALTTGRGNYAQFRIYTPPKSDYYRNVAVLDNSEGTQEREFQFTEQKGISMTKGHEISATISTEIGAEIKSAFSVGLTFSTTWKTFQQTTYSKMITVSVKTKVRAGNILYVKQLTGKYGHFVIHANHFKFVNVKAKNSRANTEEIVYARGTDEYNRGEFMQEPEGTNGELTVLHNNCFTNNYG